MTYASPRQSSCHREEDPCSWATPAAAHHNPASTFCIGRRHTVVSSFCRPPYRYIDIIELLMKIEDGIAGRRHARERKEWVAAQLSVPDFHPSSVSPTSTILVPDPRIRRCWGLQNFPAFFAILV